MKKTLKIIDTCGKTKDASGWRIIDENFGKTKEGQEDFKEEDDCK